MRGLPYYGVAMPPRAALSPKRVGTRSRSLGTMGGWPEFTTETCAKLNARRQSRILCKGSDPIAAKFALTKGRQDISHDASVLPCWQQNTDEPVS